MRVIATQLRMATSARAPNRLERTKAFALFGKI
jgi:hypothetical protein